MQLHTSVTEGKHATEKQPCHVCMIISLTYQTEFETSEVLDAFLALAMKFQKICN